MKISDRVYYSGKNGFNFVGVIIEAIPSMQPESITVYGVEPGKGYTHPRLLALREFSSIRFISDKEWASFMDLEPGLKYTSF